MARRFKLIKSPEPNVAFIPAPRIRVKRLANGATMVVLPMNKHQPAREIARRWRGSLELLPVEPSLSPSARASRKGDTR
jgi:hypothetical protein